jgi:hypothetical protein
MERVGISVELVFCLEMTYSTAALLLNIQPK